MSDLAGRLRDAATVYDASYPPDILGGASFRLSQLDPNTSVENVSTQVQAYGAGFEDGAQLMVIQADPDPPYNAGAVATFVSAEHMTFDGLYFGPGITNLAVQNPGGEMTNSRPMTVAAAPAPVVVSVDPTTITTEANQPFTIHGANFTQYDSAWVGSFQCQSVTMVDANTHDVLTGSAETGGPGPRVVRVESGNLVPSNTDVTINRVSPVADDEPEDA